MLKALLKKIPWFVRLKRSLLPGPYTVDRFLTEYFRSKGRKTVIQIGANDGEMCDPLRPFLRTPGEYVATLIEPLPYYVCKLRKLYQDRDDITIVQAAIGVKQPLRNFYFIPPGVADLMNGDGPANNWAHGQGSFNRETVIHWINENAFRGKAYREQIPFFISAIAQIELEVRPARDFIPAATNLLVVIDVQGFELEVLKGIDWNHPPKHIMLEDDFGDTSIVRDFLHQKGYRCICGNVDKVFRHEGSLRASG